MDDEELEKVKKNLENTEFNNDEEDLAEMEDDGFKRVESVSLHSKKEFEDVDGEEETSEIENLDEEETEEKEEEEEEKEEKKVEYNNEKEDQEVMKTDESFVEKTGINKTIIILCCVIAVLLIVVLLLIVVPAFRNESSGGSSGGSDHDEEIYEDEGKPTTPKVDIAKGSSYFINDKFIYLKSNNSAYISDIEGKVIYQDDDKACTMMSNSYFICERNEEDKVKYVIKKIDDSGNVENVAHEVEFGSDGRVVKSGSKVIGYYSEDKKGSHLAVLIGDSIKELDLEYFLFSESSNDALTKKIYGGRYAIITDSSKKTYGIYDLVDGSTLIKPKYDEVVYLYDDLFVTVKNGKSGIVTSNDSVKLDFKYDAIVYSNNLYFVGNGTSLKVFNKDFKEIGESLKVKSLSNYKYYDSQRSLRVKSCADKVILLKNNSMSEQNQYAVADQTGKFKDYDFTNFAVIGDRVVTLKNKQLTLYDSSFNKIQEFTVPNDINIDLNTAVIYVESNLVLNGCYVFDINSGSYLYKMNNLSRSYQGYYINLDFNDGFGKAEVFLDDKPIGSIENIDVSEFLKAENNGIRLTNEYFILSVGDKNLIIKR